MSKTITMPLDEYNEMKAELERLKSENVFFVEYLHSFNGLLKITTNSEALHLALQKIKDQDKSIHDLLIQLSDLESVIDGYKKILAGKEKNPSFIRKIFGA